MRLLRMLIVPIILTFWIVGILFLYLGFTLTEIVWHYGIVLVYLFLLNFIFMFQMRSKRNIVSSVVIHNLFFIAFLLAIFVLPSHHHLPPHETQRQKDHVQELYNNYVEAKMNNEFEESDLYVDTISHVIFNLIKEEDSKFQGINIYTEIVSNIISSVIKMSDENFKDKDIYFEIVTDFLRRIDYKNNDTNIATDTLSDIADMILVREFDKVNVNESEARNVVSVGNQNSSSFESRNEIVSSDQINILDFYNVDNMQFLQAISVLIAEEKYYAAEEMLHNYYSIFGITESSRYIAERLDSYLETGAIKGSKQRDLSMELELVSWKKILENTQKNENDIIVGYRTLLTLYKDNPTDERIFWLLQEYIEHIEEFTFFAGELRLNMASRRTRNDVSFTLQNDAGSIFVSVDTLVSTRDAGYLRGLELTQIDEADNTIWHLETPYAKMQKNTILLAAIERNTVDKRHVPIVSSDSFDSTDFFVLSVPIQHQELRHVFFEITDVELWQVLNMIFFWMKVSLPLNELYIYIILECLPALILLIGGYIIMNFSLASLFKNSNLNKFQRFGSGLEFVLIISSIIPIELLIRNFFSYMAMNSTISIFQYVILASFICYLVFISIVVFMLYLNSIKYHKLIERR